MQDNLSTLKNALYIFKIELTVPRDFKVKISINSRIRSILNHILSGYNLGAGTIEDDPMRKTDTSWEKF